MHDRTDRGDHGNCKSACDPVIDAQPQLVDVYTPRPATRKAAFLNKCLTRISVAREHKKNVFLACGPNLCNEYHGDVLRQLLPHVLVEVEYL
jgi:hypothetical protein